MRTHQRVATLGIVTASILTGISVRGAEANVDWTNRVNVSVSGNMLQKTAGCDGCEDAGAVSYGRIWRGDGYVEFRPGETNTFWLAGLSQGDDGTAFEDIDFAFRFNGAGRADVMENGAYKGGDTTYAAGDLFRVAVTGGRVQYFKNGQLLHTSASAPRYPLLLDTALGSLGTTVRDADVVSADRPGFFDDEEGFVGSRFDALDANGNGRVEWYEWNGSWDSFDARDFDQNGVLTTEELPDLLTDPAHVRTIELDPTRRWQDTGVWIAAGDVVSIEATGLVQLSTNAGDDAWPSGARSGRRASGAPLQHERAGALIARIGTSEPFYVGDHRSVVAPTSGRLYLGVNDDHFADNTGAFRVSIAARAR